MRIKPMIESAQEIIGTVMTAILGVLWWDIRKIRNERGKLKETIITDVRKEMGTRMDDKDGGFLTSDKHTDLCTINTLRQNEDLVEKLGEMIDRKFAANGFSGSK